MNCRTVLRNILAAYWGELIVHEGKTIRGVKVRKTDFYYSRNIMFDTCFQVNLLPAELTQQLI